MKINPIGHLVKTNPNKPNLPEGEIDAKSVFTKDYEENVAKGYEKTKPKQTQFPKGQNEIKLLFNKGL